MSLFDVFVTGFQRGNSWDTHTSQRIGGFLTREEAEQNAKHLIDEQRLGFRTYLFLDELSTAPPQIFECICKKSKSKS